MDNSAEKYLNEFLEKGIKKGIFSEIELKYIKENKEIVYNILIKTILNDYITELKVVLMIFRPYIGEDQKWVLKKD